MTDNSEPKDEVMPVLDIYEILEESIIDQIRTLLTKSGNVVNEEDLVTDEEPIASSDVLSENSEDKNNEVKESDVKDVPKSVKISVNGLSKFERTRIHKAVKDNFESLETITVDEESNKYIVVKRFDNSSVKRKAFQWPKEKGEYIHFVLYKENKETQRAVQELALKMGISGKNLSIAGTKDKRAITTQMVSAWKVPPKKVWYASRKLSNIEVGHFQFNKEPLSLGDLKGNHFDIVLRDIKSEEVSSNEDIISNAKLSLESLKNIGFINYYGMQRFGYVHSKPYEIGILILHQQWEQVVNKLLSTKPHDQRLNDNPSAMSFNEAINLWHETKDASLVYKKFPFKWSPEGTLLRGLSRVGPKDFQGAIVAGMVRQQRLLYLHCYQSYLWNKSASYRIKTYGLKVVPGDLLLLKVDIDGDDIDDQIDDKVKDVNKNIVVADEDNMKMASIYDIVLPMLGTDNLLPNNSVSDYIKSLLAEDDVTIDLYRNLPKQWALAGAYRKVFVRPEKFDYEWVTYDDPNIPLIDSDFTLIHKKKRSKVVSTTDSISAEIESRSSEGQKLALKLSMSLPSSCYATMVCRQIARTETTILESKEWLKSKHNL